MYNFNGLFIYDIANNHQGNLNHGLKIIDEVSNVSNKAGVCGALKFQFRNLDTFIHKDYIKSNESIHIQRFLNTRLSNDSFKEMKTRIKNNGLKTIATPFDEESVDLIDEFDIELVKIASCSANDWPLLDRISRINKPIVLSTGGLYIEQIDNVVDFLEKKKSDFSIMHCVPLYPTLPEDLQLNQISMLINRYPKHTIGFSTHEEPNNLSAIKIAYAKGARIFERHVGIETNDIKLNQYSSTPNQLKLWLDAYKEAKISCGAINRPPAKEEIISSIKSLRRGVFVRNKLSKNHEITFKDIFFAMPLLKNQLDVTMFFEGMRSNRNYSSDEPIEISVGLQERNSIRDNIIRSVILEFNSIMNNAKICIPDVEIDLSHHYGIERFHEFGAIIVNCINQEEYCKKYVIQLPNQKHPYHHHKRKKETFQILYGDLEIELNGNVHNLVAGDTINVDRNVWHKFSTNKGVVFEEVSTKHYNDDSYYEDVKISLLPREQRKTILKEGEN
jgi:N-acetylneuraminate synthase